MKTSILGIFGILRSLPLGTIYATLFQFPEYHSWRNSDWVGFSRIVAFHVPVVPLDRGGHYLLQ